LLIRRNGTASDLGSNARRHDAGQTPFLVSLVFSGHKRTATVAMTRILNIDSCNVDLRLKNLAHSQFATGIGVLGAEVTFEVLAVVDDLQMELVQRGCLEGAVSVAPAGQGDPVAGGRAHPEHLDGANGGREVDRLDLEQRQVQPAARATAQTKVERDGHLAMPEWW